jgi:hypothetical protein
MQQHFAQQLPDLMQQHFIYQLPNHHYHFFKISFLQPLQPSTKNKTTISLLIVNFNELN